MGRGGAKCHLSQCLHSVLNVKTVVAAVKQEKALVVSLLCNNEPSCGPSFEALAVLARPSTSIVLTQFPRVSAVSWCPVPRPVSVAGWWLLEMLEMRIIGTTQPGTWDIPPLVLEKSSIRRFAITEKAPTRAFSWLKAPTNI